MGKVKVESQFITESKFREKDTAREGLPEHSQTMKN